MINCLHHFEILTHSSSKLINYFKKGYNFDLINAKQTGSCNQFFLNSNSINFLVTCLSNEQLSNQKHDDTCYRTSLDCIKTIDSSLYNKIISKRDTVFNAAFRVKDLDQILFNCRKHNVRILKDKYKLFDTKSNQNGYVECAIIDSCIDGVAHSLFNMNNYSGNFLPGFERTIKENDKAKNNLTHFDHLTYATFPHTSNRIIEWYGNIFNMKRFRIEKKDEDGLIVKTGDSGMNLKVINYWMCGETGLEYDNIEKKNLNNTIIDSSFKFVISEPLEQNKNKKNQISIFLDENNGPGIQHIGMFSNDIFKTVQESKSNSDVSYYVTPEEYYNTKEKIEEINNCGLNVDLLKKYHVLLDSEIDVEDVLLNELKNADKINSYLLQVFTQPIFEKNTVFLELIQRVGKAKGFGAGNIKALWNAVQYQIKNTNN